MTSVAKTDREQVQELLAIYAAALDAKDYDAVAGCFSPDAVVAYAGYSSELSGRRAIVEHMLQALDPLDVTQHFFANFIIDLADGSAHVACDVLAQHVRRGVAGGETFLAGGKYEAVATKADGCWRFSRITARTLWSEGNRDLLPASG